MALSAGDMVPPISASYSGTVSPGWGSRAPLFLLAGGWGSRLRPHVYVGLGLGGADEGYGGYAPQGIPWCWPSCLILSELLIFHEKAGNPDIYLKTSEF